MGECHNGQLLEISYESNELACLHACRHKHHCKWFTFAPDLGSCEQLEDCPSISSESCPNCITGRKHCPICWVTGQCEGQIIHVAPANGQEECGQVYFVINFQKTKKPSYLLCIDLSGLH